MDYSTAQWTGIAFVALGIILAFSWAIRAYVPGLASLFIPASVIAGFVILLVGPQILGALTGTQGLLPKPVLNTWAVLPGLLINVVFAAVMLGKQLPSIPQIWQDSAPHFIFGSVLSFGQFALGALAVALVLTPVFGLSDAAGSIIELSFAGGHGTIAGLGGLLNEVGAPEVVDLGLGLATISMVTGVIGGTALVKYALKNPHIQVARQNRVTAAEAKHIVEVAGIADEDLASVDQKNKSIHESSGMTKVTAAFMFLGLAIALAILLLQGLRFIFGSLGIDVFENFPLFPFTVIGGFLVQLLATKLGLTAQIDRTAVSGISSIALDVLIASAIGTMSLSALGDNVPALLILTVIAVAWSVFGLLYIAPRLYGRHWFEHGLADFGQSQGNVATGFILAEMVDPRHQTNVASAYGYKQLTYEPLLGGGILTAFSVPLIVNFGSLAFGIVSAVITGLLILWGITRKRKTA